MHAPSTSSRRLPRLVVALLLLGAVHAGSGSAAPIAITNAGFEDFALSAPGEFTRQQGGFAGAGGIVSPDAVPGWTTVPLTADSASGTFWSNDPALLAPEGTNVAYVATILPGTGATALEQTLPSVLTANTRYTLEVDVFHSSSVAYAVQLRAGAVVLAEDLNGLAANAFRTSTLVYETTGSDPALGAPLVISLQGFETDGATPLFDDVRLDATVIPEPGTALLLGLGLTMLGTRRRS